MKRTFEDITGGSGLSAKDLKIEADFRYPGFEKGHLGVRSSVEAEWHSLRQGQQWTKEQIESFSKSGHLDRPPVVRCRDK